VTGSPTWATGTGPRGCPAVARHGDEGFAGDESGLQQTEVVRRRREPSPVRCLYRQADRGRVTRGVRRAGIDLVAPGTGLRRQVGIVGEAAPEEEVALDPLDQRLNAALLVAGARITGLGMEAEFAGELQQGRGPHRLGGRIPTAGHRLHVVKDKHPGHPAERQETVDQPPEQRLLAHVAGEPDPGPAAVLEPAGQEVARDRRLLGKGEAPNLAPVHLEVLARQALEPDRDVPGRLQLRQFPPDPAHQIVKDGAPTGVRLRGVGARHFEDSNIRQPRADPLFDLPAIGFDLRLTPTLGRWLVHRLLQHAGNRRRTPSELGRDPANALAPFGHDLNRAALHLP
jgi:hypothetical protein